MATIQIECPECDGLGHCDLSDCCGAEMDIDVGLCYECHDHCEPEQCHECNGTGKINQII